MVKVTVVDEKEAESRSPYGAAASEASVSTESISSVGSELDENESVIDRLAALVDIVPPSTRHSISTGVSSTASVVKRGAKLAGNLVWVVTTSALLIALPLSLALEDEAKIVAQEREQLEQQQGQQQMLAPPPGMPKQIVPPGL